MRILAGRPRLEKAQLAARFSSLLHAISALRLLLRLFLPAWLFGCSLFFSVLRCFLLLLLVFAPAHFWSLALAFFLQPGALVSTFVLFKIQQ
jgi:hypothetical protein